MQFLYPIGFFALASLVFPILIHLWRVKTGKTLKIGSISLLSESAASNARSFRLNNLVLLFLRCLLLSLIALLLAKPYLQDNSNKKKPAGWILLLQQKLSSIYAAEKQTIDSLLTEGYEIHHFGYGFKRLELRDTATLSKDTLFQNLNYSSLLKQLNHQLPPQFKLYIFASRYAALFDDKLPATHLNLTWKDNQANENLATHYTELLNKKFQAINTENMLSYKQISEQKSAPLHVVIHSPNVEDASYVKAGLNAISSYINQPFRYSTEADGQQPIDMLFWLDKRPISTQIRNGMISRGTIFKYAEGKIDSNKTYLQVENNSTPIKFSQTVISTQHEGEAIWRNGFGNAILTKMTNKQLTVYSFYSELNPKSTDLIWRDEFVSMLMNISFGKGENGFGLVNHPTEKQTATTPISTFSADKANKNTNRSITKDLTQMIWILMVLILLFERILAFKTKPSNSN